MTFAKTIHAPTARTVKSAFPLQALERALTVLDGRRTAWTRRRAERAALRHLSDFQLRDIGLSRGDVHAIAAGIPPRTLEPHPARSKTTVARMAGQGLASAVARLRTRYEHHKAMRAMMALDDHALKDIGLHRGGIADAVRTGCARPPVNATG